MIDLTELFKLASSTIDTFTNRLREEREDRRNEVLAALDLLENLSEIHLKAITETIAPIVYGEDLAKTCDRYQELVNNADIPRGYGKARGTLEAALKMRQFKKREITESIKGVLTELAKFQMAAFMREFDSYRMADVVLNANQLWRDLSENSDVTPEHREKVVSDLRQSITALVGEQAEAIPPLETSDDMVSALRTWAKLWQRHVQRTLYGGRGLDYAIGQLRMKMLS